MSALFVGAGAFEILTNRWFNSSNCCRTCSLRCKTLLTSARGCFYFLAERARFATVKRSLVSSIGAKRSSSGEAVRCRQVLVFCGRPKWSCSVALRIDFVKCCLPILLGVCLSVVTAPARKMLLCLLPQKERKGNAPDSNKDKAKRSCRKGRTTRGRALRRSKSVLWNSDKLV
jgi:hypothetical protein